MRISAPVIRHALGNFTSAPGLLFQVSMKKYKSLELEQDIQAQRKLWRFQRSGRVAWVVALLLALAGLFGGKGPLSKSQVKDSEEWIQVEYDRFGHIRTSDLLELKLSPGAAIGGKIHVWVDSKFLKENPVQRISPEPISTKLENDRAVFEFATSQNIRNTMIVMETETTDPGVKNVALGLVGGPEVKFWKFVWP